MRDHVVVAMSGGVDSSVAAALLKEQGYEITGITMCFSAAGSARGGFAYGEGSASGGNLPSSISRRPSCCGLEGIEDARRTAHKLGIRHYVLNMQDALDRYVIRDFCLEYLKGRTPNPCVRCNQYIKFDALLKKAFALGAKYLATGHYARVVRSPQSTVRSPQYQLKKAKDKNKDQSYFLYRLGQEQLKHILFPLGNYTKPKVRELARSFDLPVADKLASQEICFLPDMDYRAFLKVRADAVIRPGAVVDSEGNILGRHKGIAFYTIGQREGLGLARGYPVYITKIDARNNKITVGVKEDALKQDFLLKDTHFVSSPIRKKVAARVKIRYNHKEALALITPLKSRISVYFKAPQFAITPGQSAVFYDKETVLGGGIIDKVLD